MVSWMEGAKDGVLSHHMPPGDGATAARIVEAIWAVLRGATKGSFAELDRAVRGTQVVAEVDQVLAKVLERGPAADRLHKLALVLCTEAPERELVKLGISLMGLFPGEEDVGLLTDLGTHDEFTIFAVVALKSKLGPGSEPFIFDIARRTEGWGRISAVERLADTSDPEIRSWMLRGGFRNSIMDEYLALTCARAGRLAEALALPTVDEELLEGVSDMLAAMARGGPGPGMEAYEQTAAALTAWIGHLEHHALTIKRLAALDDVAAFLQSRPKDAALWDRIEARRNVKNTPK